MALIPINTKTCEKKPGKKRQPASFRKRKGAKAEKARAEHETEHEQELHVEKVKELEPEIVPVQRKEEV